MKNYSILGFERLEDIVFSLHKVNERFCGLGNCPPEWSQIEVRKADITTCLEIATFCHLGFDVSHLDVARFVNEGAKIAIDFFYGDYIQVDNNEGLSMRKNPDNLYLSWYEVYRDGLHLAHMSQDSDAEKKLVDWIEPWLPFDESSYLVSEYDNSYHKLLAEYIKTGQVANSELEGELRNCRKKGPKLLLACLTAICEEDPEAFSASLKKFLACFLKYRDFGKRIATCFSIEASILCHVAKRAGIEPTGLNEKQTALIMTRETLGLAS